MEEAVAVDELVAQVAQRRAATRLRQSENVVAPVVDRLRTDTDGTQSVLLRWFPGEEDDMQVSVTCSFHWIRYVTFGPFPAGSIRNVKSSAMWLAVGRHS